MIKKFNVAGMSCAHCVMAVEKELKKIEINSMMIDIGSVELEFDPEKISETNIISAIEEAGYKVITSEQETTN